MTTIFGQVNFGPKVFFFSKNNVTLHKVHNTLEVPNINRNTGMRNAYGVMTFFDRFYDGVMTFFGHDGVMTFFDRFCDGVMTLLTRFHLILLFYL